MAFFGNLRFRKHGQIGHGIPVGAAAANVLQPLLNKMSTPGYFFFGASLAAGFAGAPLASISVAFIWYWMVTF